VLTRARRRMLWALPIGLCVVAAYVALGRAGTGGAELYFRSGLAEATAEQLENRRRRPGWPWCRRRHGLGIQPAERFDQSRAREETGASDCCTLPPSMIHFDKEGNVIGSFAAPQGHGMDVDSKGFRVSGAEQRPQVRHAQRQDGRRDPAQRPRPRTARSSMMPQLPNHMPGWAVRGRSRDSYRRLRELPVAVAEAGEATPTRPRRRRRRAAFRAEVSADDTDDRRGTGRDSR
jgi:hypothetical protein